MRKFLILLLVFLNFSIFAQIHKEDYLVLNKDLANKNGKNLDIALYIIGPGSEVWAKWGHVGLSVKDLKNNRELVYDWGIFNPNQEGFIKNFLLGNLNYLADYSSAKSMLMHYTYSKRDIYKINLNLDNYSKSVIATYAENTSAPGKNGYAYRFFDNNCSTKIRDIIDMGINGELYNQTQKKMNKTIRDLTFLYTYKAFHVEWAFQFILGAELDEVATPWTSMFLPLEMKNQLEKVSYKNSNGKTVKLVKSIEYLNKAEGITPVLKKGKATWLSSLAIGICIGALGCILFLFSSLKKSMRILSGVYMALVAILLTFASFALFELVAISNFSCTHQNLNILYANPSLFVMFIISILFAGGVRYARMVAIIGWGILSVLVIATFLLSFLFPVTQNISVPVSTFAPIYILFFIGLIFAKESI